MDWRGILGQAPRGVRSAEERVGGRGDLQVATVTSLCNDACRAAPRLAHLTSQTEKPIVKVTSGWHSERFVESVKP